MKYRKKPVEIEAIQYTGENLPEVLRFIEARLTKENPWRRFHSSNKSLFIETLEGTMEASTGDYIICGIKGEFYPCKPDIFEMTYEQAEV